MLKKRVPETFLEIVEPLTLKETQRLFDVICKKTCNKKSKAFMAQTWADAANRPNVPVDYYPRLKKCGPKSLQRGVEILLAQRKPILARVYRSGIGVDESMTIQAHVGMKTIRGIIVKIDPYTWMTDRGGPYSTEKGDCPVIMEHEFMALTAE